MSCCWYTLKLKYKTGVQYWAPSSFPLSEGDDCGGLHSLRSLRSLPLPESGGGHASTIISLISTQNESWSAFWQFLHPILQKRQARTGSNSIFTNTQPYKNRQGWGYIKWKESNPSKSELLSFMIVPFTGQSVFLTISRTNIRYWYRMRRCRPVCCICQQACRTQDKQWSSGS